MITSYSIAWRWRFARVVQVLALLAAALGFAAEPSYRAIPLSVPASGKTGFRLLPPEETGIDFTNRLALRRGLLNQNLMNGSGVAAGDVDGDGLCDLFFCGMDVPSKLYRNKGGLKFEDITASAGVACPGQNTTGAVFADVNGDGALDLLVSSLGGGVRLFINDGHGHFTEKTDEAGLRSNAGSTSMALADIDGDGTLDLYVTNIPRRPVRNELTANYELKEINGERQIVSINGTPISAPELAGRFEVSPTGEIIEYGEVDDLFLNDGKGKFTRLSFTDGRFLDEEGKPLKSPPRDWGLAVQFHDLNGDGLPDLYVCNDLFTPDRIWINQGGGRFRALPNLAIRHTSLSSMGVDVADVNRDGYYDLFVSDMLSRDRKARMTQFADVSPRMWDDAVMGERLQFNHNSLLVNRGDMTYAEISFYSGVAASDWSWGGIFLDVDLDGYEDLLVPNGQQRNIAHADFATRIQAARGARGSITIAEMSRIAEEFPPLNPPKMAFRNQGNLEFEEVGEAWGFNTRSVSQGMALADLDNDGDLDVVMNNLDSPAGIYLNVGGAPRVAVRLHGRGANTAGIGAEIKVTGGPVAQHQEIICGGRYLSCDQAMRVFAAGTAEKLTIEVRWRSGQKTEISGALPNHLYEIDEPVASAEAPHTVASVDAEPFFQDVSERLNHTHSELAYNDFQIQPLLPFRLTRTGPGITWFDINHDGLDDLLIPGGSGGAMAAFLNQGDGHFSRIDLRQATAPLTADQNTILAWFPPSSSAVLVGGYSQYKPGASSSPAVAFFARGAVASAMDKLDGPIGPLAMADIYGDGNLDLFVGTTAKLGRYPEPGSGYLFRSEQGSMTLVEHWKNLGIIKGAVFVDLDNDGFPELVLACEFGPIRVFSNRHGKFTETTREWGLANETGLWQGVTVGDFDGDGRLDIASSNWGLNTPLTASPEDPKIFYYGDIAGNGTIAIIETIVDHATRKEYPAPNLNLLSMAAPFARARVADYEAYSKTTIQDLFGDAFHKLKRIELRNLASTVFLNRGDHFEAHPLPPEAQFAPAFGIVAADFDGDGAQDLFLSQNSFSGGMAMTRLDAGRGLLLLGDGHGAFSSMSGQASGLLIYGQQRGCAVSDFDADGRTDLVVAQNNGATKLYRNQKGVPGLRVRLRGPAGNSVGIGAVIRAGSDGAWGPAVEIHSGSGYWSMDSSVPVLSKAADPKQVQVRWPGGKTSLREIPVGAREVTVPISEP